MKAKVFSHSKLIGTADLVIGDESMGHLYGELILTDEYFSNVQKSVWDFTSTNKPDFEKWTSLRLNVQLENGYFLYVAGGLTIDDLPDVADEPKRIDIAGVDRHVIEDYFHQNPPRTFIEEPWCELSIDQKLAFEDELRKELGISEAGRFKLFPSNEENHFLADFVVSALCTDQRNDDVLFRVAKEDYDKDFAVVHLTWKGKKELPGYPKFEFFKDFDEFKYSRMFPDKVDWED